VLSIVACPKPFVPPFDVIQGRAIRSWKALGPDVQVILAGDEKGIAEAAREFGVDHVPEIARTPEGGLLFGDLVERCLTISRHELIAYVNADILLLPNILTAACAVPFPRFLMAGYRLDLPENPRHIDLDKDLATQLRVPGAVAELKLTTGCDYFVFTRETWRDVPRLVIGRAGIENGLIHKALLDGIPVVDSTLAVTAVHQFHNYSHLAGGRGVAFEGPDAQANLASCGPVRAHPRDAMLVLIGGEIVRAPWRGDWFRRFFVLRPWLQRSKAAYGVFRALHWALKRTRISCLRDPSPARALAAQLGSGER